jgi:transposase-like protein
MSVAEQRYKAVLAVIGDGRQVSEVAAAWGVSRQTLHAWLARYEQDGLEDLADRSRGLGGCPLWVERRSLPRGLAPTLESRVVPGAATGHLPAERFRGCQASMTAGARHQPADSRPTPGRSRRWRRWRRWRRCVGAPLGDHDPAVVLQLVARCRGPGQPASPAPTGHASLARDIPGPVVPGGLDEQPPGATVPVRSPTPEPGTRPRSTRSARDRRPTICCR